MAIAQKDTSFISILDLKLSRIDVSKKELSTLLELFQNINKEQSQ